MRIYPVCSVNNCVSTKGRLDRNTEALFKSTSDAWLNKSTKMKTLPLINTCLFASERVNNVFINLSTIMERFGHACRLTFAKSEKTSKYRFYIENEYSNYKLMCNDEIFSDKINKLEDVTKLEKIESSLAKVNPYKENSNFILQRKANAKDVLYDKEFEPDSDYVFLEDKLVGKEPLPQATMDDIQAFLDAAKEEGL